jgi:TonB family protein
MLLCADCSAPQPVLPLCRDQQDALQAIERIAPRYPQAAAINSMEGRVELSGLAMPDGSVINVEVVSSTSPLFGEPAASAFSQWRYCPNPGGAIRPVTAQINFELSDTSSADDSARTSNSSELVVSTVAPRFEYPDDYYETPAGPERVFVGRWSADFEGSTFHEQSTGNTYVTSFVDDALMEFVSVGDTHYDWSGCLDVEIVGAISEYPSPTFVRRSWLIVREVLSARAVGLEPRKLGDPCF